MAKSVNLYARIEPNVKEEAENNCLHLAFLLPVP